MYLIYDTLAEASPIFLFSERPTLNQTAEVPMLYLYVPGLPSGVKAIVLSSQERGHVLFTEYMSIRDHHYLTKNQWEPHGGEDVYDQHSHFILLLVNGKAVIGCRMISDIVGLPIREVLAEQGLPTRQIPPGSHEISRFAVHPGVLRSKRALELLGHFASAIKLYCESQEIEETYAVLISILEKWFTNLGVAIERLPRSATTRHGDSVFNTVRITTGNSQIGNTIKAKTQKKQYLT